MAKDKPIILKLNQLEASVLVRVVQEVADIIEHSAEQDLRPLTAAEDLEIDIFSHIYSQIIGQSEKMNPVKIADLWKQYEREYIKDSEERAKLN